MSAKLSRGLTISIGLVAGALVMNAGLTYWNTRHLVEDDRMVAHSHEVLDALEQLISTLKDAETGQRGYLITGEPRYLDPYNSAVATNNDRIGELERLTADNPGQQSRLGELKRHIAAKMDELKETVDLRRDRGFDAARRIVVTDRGKAEMDAARDVVRAMDREERRLLEIRDRQSRTSYVIAVASGLATALLGLLLLGILFLVLRRHLEERWRAAMIVHEQREWLRATLGCIGDAVIATDGEGRVTFLNAVAAALTGWTEDAARGEPLEGVFRIVNEQSRQTVENPALRAIRDGIIVGLANHTILIARDGREFPIDDSAAPIRDGTGRVNGAVLVFRDISERKGVLEALRESDRRKDEFLATLAHELRNPLAPLRNGLQVLRLTEDIPMREQALEMMERQLAQLVRLVDDLLDVGRITKGKIELRKERLDVADVINDALETSRPLIESSRHDLEIARPPRAIPLVGDRTRLAQVVSNLLNNASKYTPDSGWIRLIGEQDEHHAVFRVRDNGVGIPQDMLPRIFDMFTQVDGTRERAQGGLGIGLTLVRRLVELHGGTVEAHSSGPGQGSEFVVRLPIAPPVPEAESTSPASASACSTKADSRLAGSPSNSESDGKKKDGVEASDRVV
jgi:PAS domain S-box-containing protein